MKCAHGHDTIILPGYHKRDRDEAMNVQTRKRKCLGGCVEFLTVEIDASELSELRRKAYLNEMQEMHDRDASTVINGRDFVLKP